MRLWLLAQLVFWLGVFCLAGVVTGMVWAGMKGRALFKKVVDDAGINV